MDYHNDYSHGYNPNYPTSGYIENSSHSPISHQMPSPQASNDRLTVPPSPSSFIYNRSTASYSSPGAYGNEEIPPNHVSYPPPYHAPGQQNVPMMYPRHALERQHSLETQRQPSPRQHHHPQTHSIHPSHSHAPLATLPPPPPPPPQHTSQHVHYHYHQQFSEPSSSSMPLTGQEIYAAADVPVVLTEEQDRIMRVHFPHDHQANLRRALWFVLQSLWKQNNEREPTDEALLQFTSRNGKLYQCSFWKQDGKCIKEFDRKDRVLDHIRTHIDLQPFTCREQGCYQRFCSKPDLLQHEKNKEKTQCDQCGAKILPKNLARHKATALCRSGRWPVNTANT